MAGWWDIFLQPQILAFDCYQNRGGTGGNGNSFLIIVPTGHCQQGTEKWPANAADGLGASEQINSTYRSPRRSRRSKRRSRRRRRKRRRKSIRRRRRRGRGRSRRSRRER